jgi:hypothetical protein
VPERPAGSKRFKPAEVRFYLDADVLGLAKVLVQLRNDVTYPGDPGGVLHKRQRPPCPITDSATLDPDWIPEVTARGWLIITRDSHIQDNPAEIAAVRDHAARMVVLGGRDAGSTFRQLEVLMAQWRAIEARSAEPGPYIYVATRRTFWRVDLKTGGRARRST